jgi:hypothetical protein
LISDIEKFLAVAIFKMAATIPHKFNIAAFVFTFCCCYVNSSASVLPNLAAGVGNINKIWL